MSTPTLNHLVSRFLTRPWENSQRYLYFYDFEKNQILKTSSETLFTQENALDPEIEIRFRDLIETPLGAYVADIRKGIKSAMGEKLAVVRAIHLIFLAQSARILEAADKQSKSLTTLLQMDDAHLHALLTISMNDSRITIAPTEKGKPLYYPQNGVFSFPVIDKGCPTNWTYGMGIPITINRAILLISKTVRDEDLNAMPVAELSIGPDNCNRVVIPALLAEKGNQIKIVEAMKIHRKLGLELIANAHSIRLLVREAYEKLGLPFVKVEGSFHNKVKVADLR